MRKKIKNCIAMCVLITFSFLVITPAYADTTVDTTLDNIIEQGQYVEDGQVHDFTIEKNFDGSLTVKSYICDTQDNKILDENFILDNDGENIYIDGELVAKYKTVTKDIAPLTVIDSSYYTGKCINLISDSLTRLGIASTLAGSLVSGAFASISISLLMSVADTILKNSINTVFYEQYIIMETFPPDKPRISIRETNKVRYHSGAQLGNPITDWISKVHEEV